MSNDQRKHVDSELLDDRLHDNTDDDTLDFCEQIKNEHLIEKLMGEVTESNKEKETINTEMKDLQDQIEALKKREEEANSRYESAKDALAQQLEENKEEVARLQEIVEDDKRKLQGSEKNLKMLVLRCNNYEKRALELIQDNTSAEVEHRDKIARICTKTDIFGLYAQRFVYQNQKQTHWQSKKNAK